MSEEKALALFGRCYNCCDFTGLAGSLGKRAIYEAFNRIYRHEGRDSVTKALTEKAAELRALPRPNRAYRGFLNSMHELLGLPKCENCVVLTKDDPNQAIGIVRIRYSFFRIREIRVLDPAKYNFTRGSYLGKE